VLLDGQARTAKIDKISANCTLWLNGKVRYRECKLSLRPLPAIPLDFHGATTEVDRWMQGVVAPANASQSLRKKIADKNAAGVAADAKRQSG
jgi:hypothetical protein